MLRLKVSRLRSSISVTHAETHEPRVYLGCTDRYYSAVIRLGIFVVSAAVGLEPWVSSSYLEYLTLVLTLQLTVSERLGPRTQMASITRWASKRP